MSKAQRTRGADYEPQPPKTKLQRTRGRPTDFSDAVIAEACFLARMGATDEEIAEEIGCSISRLYVWYNQYPEFKEAVQQAKEAVDDRVERSYLSRAIGFTHTVEKVFANGHRTTVRERVLADTGAAANWLANRRRHAWGQKQELQLVVPGNDNEGETDVRQLALAALALVSEASYDVGPQIEAVINPEEGNEDDHDQEAASSVDEGFELSSDGGFDPDFD
jgi:hypothetical protein